MKIKFILSVLMLCFYGICSSQYIGVKARYTETRLVDDSPNPPKRENRLILSFYEVTFTTDYVWTPVSLSNYDIYIYKEGLQFGNNNGGVLDSTGNNYPGYAWPAPRVVSYYNTLGIPYIDCNPNVTSHYVVNGQELDCGFITVSYWDIDYGNGNSFEAFTAPNICLPYYDFGHPYYFLPGNLNFDQSWSSSPPYNLYNFSCGGPLQLVRRGLLVQDTGSIIVTLPVRFADVEGKLEANANARISWSNLTESDIDHYEIQSSVDNGSFQTIGTVLPSLNNSGRADYHFTSLQTSITSLYRIKAVEVSGQIFYSTVILLKKADSNINGSPDEPVLFIYPNPVRDAQFVFRLSNAVTGRYISSIITPEGKQIKHKMISHTGGDMIRSIDVTGLLPGVYHFVLVSFNNRYSQTIIIQ